MKSLLSILTPLLLGVLFYWLARPFSGSQLARWMGEPPITLFFGDWLPEPIFASLPNFLWGYSLCVVLLLIWRPTDLQEAAVCGSVTVVAAFLFEWLQKRGIVGGTFDLLDVLATFVAAGLALVFNKMFLADKE